MRILILCSLTSAALYGGKVSPFCCSHAIIFRRQSFVTHGLFASSTEDAAVVVDDPYTMKLRDIQTELKRRGVPYTDCFDRDSLTRRLIEARRSGDDVFMDETQSTSPDINQPTDDTTESFETATPPAAASSFDREQTLADLRALKVAELRGQCAERNIRWANMFDKEDLVQALLSHKEKAFAFSVTGKLTPGKVADLTANDLAVELTPGASSIPLLLDVYATWCGPCQMLAPQLAAAAAEMGDTIRVAKIDSDKYPEWASRLKVGGLPTIIVFDATSGKELKRVEGALMKEGIMKLAREHLRLPTGEKRVNQ